MKRMLNVIMCAMLIFALAACGGSSSAPAKNRIRVDNVIGMTVDQAVETLKKNGAVNIVTNRDDYADVESDRLIVVSQNDTEGKEIQPEWEVKLTCRRLCSVYVEAKSKTNLLLHTYDMEIYLDDEMIGTAANGETICATVDAIEGEHTLKAVKASNNNVSATKQFTVAGDTTVLTLIAHGGKIEFEAFESSAGIDEPVPEETESETLDYSSNTREEAANGNSGVFAYAARFKEYDLYLILDFDEGVVYKIQDPDTVCDRIQITGGDLNSGMIITYHAGDAIWNEICHYKYEGRSEHLILKDQSGGMTDFYPVNLEKTLALRDTMKITDY